MASTPPSDGLRAIWMLEDPHGWILTIPPRGKKALLHLEASGSSCTKAGQGQTHSGRRKVQPGVALCSRQIPVAHVLLSSRQITDNTLIIGMHLALCNAWLENSSSNKK